MRNNTLFQLRLIGGLSRIHSMKNAAASLAGVLISQAPCWVVKSVLFSNLSLHKQFLFSSKINKCAV